MDVWVITWSDDDGNSGLGSVYTSVDDAVRTVDAYYAEQLDALDEGDEGEVPTAEPQSDGGFRWYDGFLTTVVEKRELYTRFDPAVVA